MAESSGISASLSAARAWNSGLYSTTGGQTATADSELPVAQAASELVAIARTAGRGIEHPAVNLIALLHGFEAFRHPSSALAGAPTRPATDDWPQLYLRAPEIPWAPLGQGMAAIALLSLALLVAFAPRARLRPNWQMFFLGAGFMLLETKGVVHMALLFGSTWVVNSVVFFAILVMILFANLFVMVVKPRNLVPYYALLIVALLVNALVPMNYFLSMDVKLRTVASCLVVFVPVFFAGVRSRTSPETSRT